MASSRPGHRSTRSFHGIRTSVAVLPMAPPFSPAMDSNRMHDYSPKVRPCKRVNSASVIVRKDPEFESREPTSPKVSCIGQIKLKPQWVKENPAKLAKNSNNSNNKLSRLKKFMFGKRHGNDSKNKNAAEEVTAKPEEEARSIESFPSLGNIKRYASARYDLKFGDMFVQEEPDIGKNGEEGASAINIWQRRSVAPLHGLDVDKVQSFQPKMPFST